MKINCEKCKSEFEWEQFGNEPSIVDGDITGSTIHFSEPSIVDADITGSAPPRSHQEPRTISCPNCGYQIPVQA